MQSKKILFVVWIVLFILLLLIRINDIKLDPFGTSADILGTTLAIITIIVVVIWIYNKIKNMLKK